MTANTNLFLDILSSWLPKDDPLRASMTSGTIILNDGRSLSGSFAVACYICQLCNWPLLGSNELEAIQIQDLVFDHLNCTVNWDDLTNMIKTKTFLVGTKLSLADVALYSRIYYPFSRLDQNDRLVYYHITRYFDLIQHLVAEYYNDDLITRIIAIDLDLEVKEQHPSNKTQGDQKDSKKEVNDTKKDKKDAKKDKKDAKKEENKVEVKSAPLPSQLKIMVGKVVSVKKHPDAETLYVEEIDIGDSNPITVVSGLVKFIPESELLNTFVVLLANLKPAKMRGIESQAMVLTAESPNGSIELIRPPPNSLPGELMSWNGISGDPEPLLNPKKKIWETIQPSLGLTEDCTVVFRNDTTHTLGSSKGVCKSKSITDGKIK